MTLCVTWKDQFGLHMACDSRLSMPNGAVADIGIKLLRMPCRIFGPWELDRRELIWDTDIAMLVSGSHLTSTLVKESLEEVVNSLQAVPGTTCVSFDKIAKICFVAYQQVSTKVCEALASPKGIAGVHLAGFCPEKKRLRVFEFTTKHRTNEHECSEILIQDRGHKMLGSGTDAASKHIEATGCTPFRALQHVINTGGESSVGGPIQYGRFVQKEFKIYLQSELQGGTVRYPRGGLDLNAPEFQGRDDLFINVSMLEHGKELPVESA